MLISPLFSGETFVDPGVVEGNSVSLPPEVFLGFSDGILIPQAEALHETRIIHITNDLITDDLIASSNRVISVI